MTCPPGWDVAPRSFLMAGKFFTIDQSCCDSVSPSEASPVRSPDRIENYFQNSPYDEGARKYEALLSNNVSKAKAPPRQWTRV